MARATKREAVSAEPVEGPWDLPEGWRWDRLGDLCSYVNRGRGPKYVPANGVRVLNQRCIRWEGVDFTYCKQTDVAAAARLSAEQDLRGGDILWNSTGTGTIGRAAVFRAARDERFVADSHVTIVRLRDADPCWVHHWISTHTVQQAVAGIGSTNQVELGRETVLDLPVPRAQPDVERRTLERIEGLFTEIEEGERALEATGDAMATYRKALLQAAFTGELTEDWRGSRPMATGHTLLSEIAARRKVATTRDPQSPAEEAMPDSLPDSWAWCSLGQLFSIYVGATPSRGEAQLWGGPIPWVSSGEVAFCRIGSTRELIAECAVSADRVHPPGTVLLGMIGEGKTRGQAAILDIAAAHNQNCASIRVSETPILPEYVYWWLEHRYQLTRADGAGGNQPALNKARVAAIAIPLPPLAEIREIVRRLSAALAASEAATEPVIEVKGIASTLRQSILAAAFRGELVA